MDDDWSDSDLIEREDYSADDEVALPKLDKSSFLMEIEEKERQELSVYSLLDEEKQERRNNQLVCLEQEMIDYSFKKALYILHANILPNNLALIVVEFAMQGHIWGISARQEYEYILPALAHMDNIFAPGWYRNPYESIARSNVLYYRNQLRMRHCSKKVGNLDYQLKVNASKQFVMNCEINREYVTEEEVIQFERKWKQATDIMLKEKSESLLTKARKWKLI